MWGAVPVAAAFLLELPFYLLPAFGAGRLRNPWILAATCVAPYLVYSVPTGEFRIAGFALLAAIAVAVSCWYALLPKHPLADAGFLVLVGAVYLSKVFDRIYLSPLPELHHRELSTLGHLMLIRTAAIAIRAIRGGVSVEFRFLPNRGEWIAGFRWGALAVLLCGAALWALGIAELRPQPHGPLVAVAEFLGILWVVALSEEFFFRGLLQQWLEGWTASGTAALATASFIFGCAHLGFHGVFPNWRFAIVAAVFGLCCGLAWRETRSIQTSMVTHALAATLYRVFFV